MAERLDALSEFESFCESVLPALRQDLEAGLSPKQLREKYQSLVQARLLTTALIEKDAGKVIAVGKDILDRAEGKAKEVSEVTHKLDKLSDEQLDAVLNTQLEDLKRESNKKPRAH